MPIITNLSTSWILDSRAIPTIFCQVTIDEKNYKYTGQASVPSGASTGKHEALELRDGRKAFGGKGVDKAIDNILNKIGPKILGQEFTTAKDLDELVLSFEKSLTPDGVDPSLKTALGANAILGVSMAAHRAFASFEEVELWEYLRALYFDKLGQTATFPRLMCNIFNGGAHANNGLAIQEFMVVPHTGNLQKDVQTASEIYNQLKNDIKENGQSVAVGDEGGFAPKFANTEKVLDKICTAIEESGYDRSACDISLDCAASEFFDSVKNIYTLDETEFDRTKLNDKYYDWNEKYQFLSIEDAFAEDDLLGWSIITSKLGKKLTLIGDDLFVTNPKRFSELAIDKKLANGVLVKPNQIGSILETCELINLAIDNNYTTAISHRSGETNDTFIADLAVACKSEFIKLGAPARGERTAKYNRLLEIWEMEQNR